MLSRVRVMGVVLALTVSLTPTTTAAEPQAEAFTPNPQPHSTVIDWIEAMLLAIEKNPPAPTATTWRMWVTVASMYDAWAAYDDEAAAVESDRDLKRPASEHTLANKQRAIDAAAHNALTYVYPRQSGLFDAVLALHGTEVSTSEDPTTPEGIGNLAADAVIRSRLTDGANAGTFADQPNAMYEGLYQTRPGDPNHWVPLIVPTGKYTDARGVPTADPADPESFVVQTFLTPQWGAVTPFALTSGDQFRPPPPPQLGSDAEYVDALGRRTSNDQAFRDQTEEILQLSGKLGDREKVIAEFWADGPHTWTPPGHWVQIAVGVALRDEHDIDEDVCMFLALTGALLDAGIVAWDAKRVYDFVRPATAIPYLYGGRTVRAWGGPNLGTQLIDGSAWRPYQSATFVTPPFSEYVSGHSTFSRAAAEVLTGYTGSNVMYDGVTRLGRDYDGDGVEDLLGQHIAVPGRLQFEQGPASPVVLRWATFRDASDEAGISRRYGGIHFQDADLRGREMGRLVGQQALRHAAQLWAPAG